MSKRAQTEAKSGIAVVGRLDAVVAFQAAGLAVFLVDPGPEVARRVGELVASGYRVIFFTEDLFESMEPVLERYRQTAVPSLVALPLGDSRRSLARLKDVVKRAVGADIFGAAEE